MNTLPTLPALPLTLLSVCESMFQLNVLNRVDANPYGRYLAYQLKNSLVKHLYQTGHCIEVLLHCQKFPCWSCDGTGEHWSGDVCYKCGGTGVYRETWHYAFRFQVGKRRFSWHQPKDMVDFPVRLTPGLPEIYKDPALPPKDNIEAFKRRAGLSIWNVALYLWMHRAFPKNVRLFELPYMRALTWEIRRRYYHYIDTPINKARQHLRAWLLGDPLDEPPF